MDSGKVIVLILVTRFCYLLIADLISSAPLEVVSFKPAKRCKSEHTLANLGAQFMHTVAAEPI